jgi:transmembrane sensor
MGNNRFLELISRKLAGEATIEELAEIERILSNDRDALESTKILQRYWEQHEDLNQFSIEEAFDKIVNRLELPATAQVVQMHRGKKRVNRKRLQYIAAASIILIAGLILFVKEVDKKDRLASQESRLIEKENPKGIKQSFVLPDGSKIWLNADSKIQFPTVFKGTTRDVYLNGEAFFDVTKNPSMPFIIHLAHGSLRVLGTSFNVRAYDNEAVVETSVVTGKVAFIPKYRQTGKKQDTVFLSPDNKVRYLLAKEEVVVEPAVSKEDSAWIAGKLVFKGMTFEEIGMQLERNFGKKIVFLSDAASRFRLTGTFQDNTLEEILYYLSKSKPFDYKITDVEVLISEEEKSLDD